MIDRLFFRVCSGHQLTSALDLSGGFITFKLLFKAIKKANVLTIQMLEFLQHQPNKSEHEVQTSSTEHVVLKKIDFRV